MQLLVTSRNFRNLEVFPNGRTVADKAKIGFYLNYGGSDSTKFTAKFNLGIQAIELKNNITTSESFKTGAKFAALGVGYRSGCPNLMTHDKLFDEDGGFLVNRKLTLFCDVMRKMFFGFI